MDIQRLNVKKLHVRCFKIKSSKTLFPSGCPYSNDLWDAGGEVRQKFFESFILIHNLG